VPGRSRSCANEVAQFARIRSGTLRRAPRDLPSSGSDEAEVERLGGAERPTQRTCHVIDEEGRRAIHSPVGRARRKPCHAKEEGGRGGKPGFPPHKNAPSRWRLRPAFRLTAAEATADRRAINLGRSVLGACRTLGGLPGRVKAVGNEVFAICEVFFTHRASLRFPPHALDLEGAEKRPRPPV
jgi:hypothetical protein